jgi:3-methyladenine DNA glycosylase Mpg
LAIGSFVEEYNNKVQVISLDEDSAEFSAKSTFDHPYPTTKIMWIPDAVCCFYFIYGYRNCINFVVSRKEFFQIYLLLVGTIYAYGKQENQTPD